MDWRAINFDWNRARAFLVTAEEGSLSAAARALGMAQPTLGRQVSALETELGVTLFERVGRGLVLTEAGCELLAHVRRMGDAAGHLALAATGQTRAIDGPIRLSATEAVSAFLLPPVIRQIRRTYPGIDIHIVASNDLSDLRRREADIAIRNTRPEDPDLIAKKLGDETGMLYAAHSYIAAHGPFASPSDLARAEFIGFGDNDRFVEALAAHGVAIRPEQFSIFTANHLVHWRLVQDGAGVGVMACSIAKQDPGVAPVTPWMPPFEFPVWLVTHRELHTSRRVRVVFDLIAEAVAPKHKST